MAHPIIWPNKLFFHAIGNTPAVCLTSDLPPELPADILLLGCGDASNVLYTVYADLGIRMESNFSFLTSMRVLIPCRIFHWFSIKEIGLDVL